MNQFSLRYGLIAGVVLALINVIFLFINPMWLYQFLINFLVGGLTYSFFMVKAIKDTKNADGGYIGFGDALLAGVVTFGIASLISMASMFVIVKTSQAAVDAELEYTLETTDSMAGMFDKFIDDEEQLEKMKKEMEKEKEKMVAEFEEKGPTSTRIGMVMLGWLMQLFIGTILALILAAIFKKEPAYS